MQNQTNKSTQSNFLVAVVLSMLVLTGWMYFLAPEKPADYQREEKLSCNCADCQMLSSFLANPLERQGRFPQNTDRRQHLHHIIDSDRCDLTHETSKGFRRFGAGTESRFITVLWIEPCSDWAIITGLSHVFMLVYQIHLRQYY